MVGNTAIKNSTPFLLNIRQFLVGVLSPSAGIRHFRKDVDQLEEGPEEGNKFSEIYETWPPWRGWKGQVC